MTSRMLQTLKGLGKRKPDKKTLREQIAQTLESSPLAESSATFDEQMEE